MQRQSWVVRNAASTNVLEKGVSVAEATAHTTEDLPEDDDEDPGTPEEQEERIKAMGIALLQSVGRAQKLFEKNESPVGDDGLLRSAEFKQLLDNLEFKSSARDSEVLFRKLNKEGSPGIPADDLREVVRQSSVISDMYNESFSNVGGTVVLSLGVAAAIFFFKGASSGLDFLTGYVVEDSLSVDNLFVFLALFKYFKIPPSLQAYCLNLGIYGAVVLRAIFIFAGLSAVQAFRPLLLGFAAFLMYASYTALFGDEDDDDDDDDDGAPAGPIMELLGKLPTTPAFDGDALFVQSLTSPGQWQATPLALCIIAVELSDILFAVDSIPAVFAVTDDPLIVYTSNIAAILGLRSLYQVLAVAAEDLVYLEKSVAVVLGFVGVKLTAEVAGFEINSLLSLFVIVSVLGTGIFLSLQEQEKEKNASADDA